MHGRPIDKDWRTIPAGLLLILLLSALSYLLLARRFGFYNDDWYLVYAGLVGGSEKFVDVFASDRPFRAYFVGLMFDLLGLKAPLYSYTSYILRTTGAIGMFWLLAELWPRQKRLAALLSALFAIYPGWTDQPTAFDYQSHLLSFTLLVFSLVLTVRAWQESKWILRVIETVLAVILQVTSLLLMEYYIGLEGFRFALLVFLAFRGNPPDRTLRSSWWQLVRSALHFLPYLAGAGGFLFWRIFLFSNTRSATDIGGMFAKLIQSPVHRGLKSLVVLVQDTFNVTLSAWFVPLYQSASGLRLRDSLAALAAGVLAAALVWAAWQWMRRGSGSTERPAKAEDGRHLFWLGSVGVIFSLIPIILGDRQVVFPDFSRFSLPGSIGAVMVIGGVVHALQREYQRALILAVLAGMAVTFHYANSVNYAENWSAVREFWWQVSWRVPQIKPETVLAAQYSSGSVNEDYFVWGPANLIYYPESYQPDGLMRTPLSAVVLTSQNIQGIQMGIAQPDRERRGIISSQDLGHALVMTMPEPSSCVHVIDGHSPELSDKEDFRTYLIAGNSDTSRIMLEEPLHTPPAELFGKEPAHAWCFYYQKAALARQRGDWIEVARLGDEAIAQSMHPVDWIEWVPFIQAYAYLGSYEKADRIFPILADNRYLKFQACHLFSQALTENQAQYQEGQDYLKGKFCQ